MLSLDQRTHDPHRYVHGGAWRDFRINAMSIEPTISALLGNSNLPPIMSRIAAIASIDYRLSAHPDFPQSPDTPATQSRYAKHPEHIEDVHAAIALLDSQYGIGNNFILAGHSCGATLAFQYVMGTEIYQEPSRTTKLIRPIGPAPVAILGVSGIYNLRNIVATHSMIREYRDFIIGAFDENEEAWDVVSPARWTTFGQTWQAGRLVVLAHSDQDELIEKGQMQEMKETLMDAAKGLKVVSVDNVGGRHDEIWQIGSEIARLIVITIQNLDNVAEKS